MRNVTYYFPSSFLAGETGGFWDLNRARFFLAERSVDWGRCRVELTGHGEAAGISAELQGSEQHERTTDPMG